jgi:predicted ATPase
VDRTPLVGRNADLDVLTGLIGTAAAGQSVVALVSGDAGIGKSTLLADLLDRVEDGCGILIHDPPLSPYARFTRLSMAST